MQAFWAANGAMDALLGLVGQLIDFVLHIDRHLPALVASYGHWVYGILFLIVFCETGLVVTPFLPGDSLLFVAGTLAAVGGLDVTLLCIVLMVAAIVGDAVNFAVGAWCGPRVFQWQDSRLFNRDALLATQAFYERHGGKTIVIARFMPLVRTFAPFVAGIGRMAYTRFAVFNVVGAALWVLLLTLAGYWFGNLDWVKRNLSLILAGIIIVSLLPLFVAALRRRRAAARG